MPLFFNEKPSYEYVKFTSPVIGDDGIDGLSLRGYAKIDDVVFDASRNRVEYEMTIMSSNADEVEPGISGKMPDLMKGRSMVRRGDSVKISGRVGELHFEDDEVYGNDGEMRLMFTPVTREDEIAAIKESGIDIIELAEEPSSFDDLVMRFGEDGTPASLRMPSSMPVPDSQYDDDDVRFSGDAGLWTIPDVQRASLPSLSSVVFECHDSGSKRPNARTFTVAEYMQHASPDAMHRGVNAFGEGYDSLGTERMVDCQFGYFQYSDTHKHNHINDLRDVFHRGLHDDVRIVFDTGCMCMDCSLSELEQAPSASAMFKPMPGFKTKEEVEFARQCCEMAEMMRNVRNGTNEDVKSAMRNAPGNLYRLQKQYYAEKAAGEAEASRGRRVASIGAVPSVDVGPGRESLDY